MTPSLQRHTIVSRAVSSHVVKTMLRLLKTDRRIPLGIFDSDLTVSGSRTGAFVTGAIVLIAFIALPLARPFLLGTVGVGLLVGLFLWRKHNRLTSHATDVGDQTEFEHMIRSL